MSMLDAAALSSCSFESLSDAMETEGYKECSYGFWDSLVINTRNKLFSKV